MKVWKIVIFIFSVLLGLAIVCMTFPKEGIDIGFARLEFPSLTEVITPTPQTVAEEEPKVEDEVKNRIDALRQARQKEFDEFCQQSPLRIYMPKHDSTYLDAFFESMDHARQHPMRILHYGDSQLECDRMTSVLRERFQEKFGGSGVGMIPAVQPIATYTLYQRVSPELNRYCVYGSADFRAPHRRYGPMAAMSRVDGNASFRFTAYNKEKFPNASKFQKVSVCMKGSGNITIYASDSTYVLSPNVQGDSVMRIYSATLPRPVTKATMNISGNMDVYSIMLDGTNGIAVDNIPMRGCSGNIFTRIDQSSFAPFFKQQNVALIILQYGGNSVPAISNNGQISNYVKSIRKQLRLFRRISPRSRILFIGPSDMSTRIGGVMQTYKYLEPLVDSLRLAVNEEGAAFWDMYRAMGGKNSMVNWVKSRPQLAGNDYVHFTPLGAEKMSQVLYDTFLLYYRFYQFRNNKETETKPDTLTHTEVVTKTQTKVETKTQTATHSETNESKPSPTAQ